jgi:cyclase
MKKIRVIARIDIKNEYVVKGIQLEGLRKIGDPNEIAKKYYKEGIDEIIFMDAVAAYYDRNSLSHIIEKACEDIFVPITVGGGIRKIEDIRKALKSGADKIAINTQAVKDPEFIKKASKIFGSQCIVASIVAKKIDTDKWEAYIDNGREPTGLNVIEWAKKLQELGAGEIMITSLDREGTKKGFDIELSQKVTEAVSIPIIVSGGMKTVNDALNLLSRMKVDAFATASALHYNLDSIKNIKQTLIKNNFKVRI